MDAPLDPALVGRIVSLVADVIGVPASALSLDSRRNVTDGWDSVANLQVIGAVEEEFGVAIPTAAAVDLRSIADYARFLGKAGVSSAQAAQTGTPRPGNG
jgi:acyl carrier protein